MKRPVFYVGLCLLALTSLFSESTGVSINVTVGDKSCYCTCELIKVCDCKCEFCFLACKANKGIAYYDGNKRAAKMVSYTQLAKGLVKGLRESTENSGQVIANGRRSLAGYFPFNLPQFSKIFSFNLLHEVKRAIAYLIWTRPSSSGSEYHLPGYRFCGPGTQLKLRLKRNDAPINHLDEACKLHDIAYSKARDMHDIHEADRLLMAAAQLRKAYARNAEERFFAEGVVLGMRAKLSTGLF